MFLKSKIRLVPKICLAGLFMALAIIFQKVVAVNNIPGFPFLRISFGGPAIIIFSSIFLGPWFGLLVGAGSDLLGYLVLDPNPFIWQITVYYAVLGFASYFIFNFVKICVKSRKSMVFAGIFMGILLAVVAALLFTNVIPNVQLWVKIVLVCSAALLLALIIILDIIFSKKHMQEVVPESTITFGIFLIELILVIIIGGGMKVWGFCATYSQPLSAYFWPVMICQILVSFVNIPMNIFLLNVFFRITKRYFEVE